MLHTIYLVRKSSFRPASLVQHTDGRARTGHSTLGLESYGSSGGEIEGPGALHGTFFVEGCEGGSVRFVVLGCLSSQPVQGLMHKCTDMHACICTYMHDYVCVCMHACMHACMYVCMYVRMYVSMFIDYYTTPTSTTPTLPSYSRTLKIRFLPNLTGNALGRSRLLFDLFFCLRQIVDIGLEPGIVGHNMLFIWMPRIPS